MITSLQTAEEHAFRRPDGHERQGAPRVAVMRIVAA